MLDSASAPGEWLLWAETSLGDNDGIAGYNIAIENASEVEHLVIGQGVPGFILQGFTTIHTCRGLMIRAA